MSEIDTVVQSVHRPSASSQKPNICHYCTRRRGPRCGSATTGSGLEQQLATVVDPQSERERGVRDGEFSSEDGRKDVWGLAEMLMIRCLDCLNRSFDLPMSRPQQQI